MQNKTQMELSFDHAARQRRDARRQRQLGSARWWFAQMRAVVDGAMEWPPAPPARPTQGDLRFASVR